MKTSPPDRTLAAPDLFEQHARNFVERLLEHQNAVMYPPLEIEPVFCKTPAEYGRRVPKGFSAPLYAAKTGDRFDLLVNRDALLGGTALALEGRLAREIGLCVQRLQPEFYSCNFRRQIYPLWPVIGLAENHMREMVRQLEAALKETLAARSLLKLELGPALVFYCFEEVPPAADEAADYRRTVPHAWTRALYLCRKLRIYALVRLLAQRSIEFAGDLESRWHQHHGFLLPEDTFLLRLLAEVGGERPQAGYAELLIEMFEQLKSRLLEGRAAPSAPGSGSIH